jgi:hypothetical protein
VNRYTPLEQRTLQVAKRLVGQREATGRNDGWIARLCQRFVDPTLSWLEGAPWCVCFALYCCHTAAGELGTRSRLPKLASSSRLYAWFRERGLLLDRPKGGCIGMVRGGPTGHSHTFLVHDSRDGVVIGVDGNYRNAVGWSRRPAGACDYGPIL